MTTRAPPGYRRHSAAPPCAAAAPSRGRLPLSLAVSLAAILLATLTPSASEGAAGWDGCIVCGGRGTADALLNLALFAPLGAALGRRGTGVRGTVALAAALSASIELAQLLVPGRDPSPPDLLFNTLGAAAGHALALRLCGIGRRGERLAPGWSLLFAATVAATGWLTAPAPPPGPYVGQWTPEIGGGPVLPARILDARAGGISIPRGRFGPEPEVRAALRSDAPLRVRWIVGWRIDRPAPLLRIVNPEGDEAAALFIHREDLVVVHHTRAARLRLDRPGMRAPDVIRGVAPGDTVTLTVRRHGRAAHTSTDRGWQGNDGIGPGRGWALLLWTMETPRGVARLLDALWIFLWTAPLGVWLGRRAFLVAAPVLVLVPAMAHLAPAAWPEAAGAVCGVLAGIALRGRK